MGNCNINYVGKQYTDPKGNLWTVVAQNYSKLMPNTQPTLRIENSKGQGFIVCPDHIKNWEKVAEEEKSKYGKCPPARLGLAVLTNQQRIYHNQCGISTGQVILVNYAEEEITPEHFFLSSVSLNPFFEITFSKENNLFQVHISYTDPNYDPQVIYDLIPIKIQIEFNKTKDDCGKITEEKKILELVFYYDLNPPCTGLDNPNYCEGNSYLI